MLKASKYLGRYTKFVFSDKYLYDSVVIDV